MHTSNPVFPSDLLLFQQITKGMLLLGPFAWEWERRPNRVIFQKSPKLFNYCNPPALGLQERRNLPAFKKSPSQEPTEVAAERKSTRSFLLENQNLTALCGFRRPGLMERAFQTVCKLALVLSSISVEVEGRPHQRKDCSLVVKRCVKQRGTSGDA